MKKRETRHFLLVVLLILFAFVNYNYAQPPKFSFNRYAAKKGDTLLYRLLYPDYDTLRRYPLVIFLHGSGERGNDNDAQLKWGVMNFATDQLMVMHPALVVAPQCPDGQDWSNINENEKTREITLKNSPTRPMELVIELIHNLVKTMPVDSNRIYITGLSSGGYGTWEAIERYPNLFAAAVPVCGGGDATRAAQIAHIPTWIFHGSEDSAVNPQYATDMATALIKAGAHPGLTMYPETGHFSWLAAYSDPHMIEWMFRQHK